MLLQCTHLNHHNSIIAAVSRWLVHQSWKSSAKKKEEVDQQLENGCRGLKGKVSGGLAECAGPAGDYMGFTNLKNWKEFGRRLALEFVL
jgi:hypothetical protein